MHMVMWSRLAAAAAERASRVGTSSLDAMSDGVTVVLPWGHFPVLPRAQQAEYKPWPPS